MDSPRRNNGSGGSERPFEYGFKEHTSVSVAIVEAIAAVERVAPTTTPKELGFTLYDYIDTDALDALFDGQQVSECLEVEFDVDCYEIRVEGSGRILVSTGER
ncbi:HalOD1 output domain-containing protein [Natronosalvus vescus]|uniref:HalOD1 output domain-containing protein n=1 Tax=Natronosalvus vescus TaxID=2953881 RepID=UPI0020919F42|nr:HalOD1 output domain-containing protein [Natronosalvus vescus]